MSTGRPLFAEQRREWGNVYCMNGSMKECLLTKPWRKICKVGQGTYCEVGGPPHVPVSSHLPFWDSYCAESPTLSQSWSRGPTEYYRSSSVRCEVLKLSPKDCSFHLLLLHDSFLGTPWWEGIQKFLQRGFPGKEICQQPELSHCDLAVSEACHLGTFGQLNLQIRL